MTAEPKMAKPPRAMYTDAAALGLSSGISALLGIGFWGLSARLVPPARLGVQTAILAIISAPAMVIATGVGDACNAIVPVAGRFRREVVARAYRVVVRWSLVLGVVAAICAVATLEEIHNRLLVALLIVGGVLAWALFILQDPLLTSVRRAYWLPIENGLASLLKVGMLAVLVALGITEPMVIASLVPCAVAVAVVVPMVRRFALDTRVDPLRIATEDGPDDLETLAKQTTVPVALMVGMFTLSPFVVTAVAGPTQGAVYSIALQIVHALDFLGVGLSVSLVVHATGAPGEDSAMALAAFKRLFMIIAVAAVALVAVSPRILTVLNREYVGLHGVRIIALLAAASVLRTGYLIWSALQRARRQLRVLTGLNAVATVVVIALLPLFADRWGATGGAIVLLAAQAVLTAGAGVHVSMTRARAS